MVARSPGPGGGRNFAVRVFGWVAAVLLGLLVVGTVLVVEARWRDLTHHLHERGRVLTRLVAQGARLGVFAEDPEALGRAAGPVLAEPDVLAVGVYAGDHRLLWAGGADAARLPRPLPPPGGVEEGGDRLAFWLPVVTEASGGGEEDLYFRSVAPRGGTRTLGHACVVVSTRELREGLRAAVGQSLAAAVVLLLAGVGVTFLVLREVTRPLQRLVDEVRTRGVVAGGGGDLGLLSDAFGRLVRSLDESFATIQALNTQLEHRVAERTAELRQANAELQQARDGLEQRVAERTAELRESHRLLLQAEKLGAVGQLAASIAHEFNNPVFGIRSVLQGLGRDEPLSPEAAGLVDLAVDECNRVANLIKDLQSLSRPSSGRVAPTDLNAAAEAMIRLCRRELQERGARVETALAPGLAPVPAVEDQLKQVILNLLRNAGDALPPGGGVVRVTTEDRGEEVALGVEDTGVGMGEDVMKRIFEPFFSTKASVKGTGLGLSVSYGIVRRHGGRLEVTSRPGQGSAFTVVLPKAQARP